MLWFDRLFTRGRDLPCFNDVPRYVRPRLMLILRRLSCDERTVQERMNLVVAPHLTIVDEELAVIIGPRGRDAIEQGIDDSDRGTGRSLSKS